MSDETIRVTEFTRTERQGRFVYALYEGRCVRREACRGRPRYLVIGGLKLTDSDRTRTRDVGVNSQLGRILLSKV
jgi:hypothetical protein